MDTTGTSPLPSSMKNAFDPWRVLNSTGCLARNPRVPLISCQAPAGGGQGQHQEMGAAGEPCPNQHLPQCLPSALQQEDGVPAPARLCKGLGGWCQGTAGQE